MSECKCYHGAMTTQITETDYFAADREADRVAAFCYGTDHLDVEISYADSIPVCLDCGTVLR